MEMTVHSGFLQKKPHIEVKTQFQENCKVTVYTFCDYHGNELTLQHFQHGPEFGRRNYAVGDDVVIP